MSTECKWVFIFHEALNGDCHRFSLYQFVPLPVALFGYFVCLACFVAVWGLFMCDYYLIPHLFFSLDPRMTLVFSTDFPSTSERFKCSYSYLAAPQLLQKQTAVGRLEQVLKVVRTETQRREEAQCGMKMYPHGGTKRRFIGHAVQKLKSQSAWKVVVCVFASISIFKSENICWYPVFKNHKYIFGKKIV